MSTLSLVMLLLAPFVYIQTIQAQSFSPGCTYINSGAKNSLYNGSGANDTFKKNEKITATADMPIANAVPSDVLLALFDGVSYTIVDQTSFPGSVSYIIPANGDYFLVWEAAGGNVTWTISCSIVADSEDGDDNHCPIFSDGRINSCDSFNPVVLYGKQNENDQWHLEIYDAEERGLLLYLPSDIIDAVPECPENNTLIFADESLQIYIFRLSNCKFYLRAPMNEPGKWYIIIFDELYPNTYYESFTTFL